MLFVSNNFGSILHRLACLSTVLLMKTGNFFAFPLFSRRSAKPVFLKISST